MNIESIIATIHKNKYIGHLVIRSMFDMGGKYIFTVSEKGYTGEPIDSFFEIDKDTLKIKEFVPHEHMTEFQEALKHRIQLPS